MDRNETLLDIFENLPIKAKCLVIEHNNFDILEEIGMYDYKIFSPIELIFYITFEIEKEINNNFIYIQPQYDLEYKNKKYIADFVIEYDEITNNNLKEEFKLIIECDGYEFHQKTKKQVEYDNKREYDLKMMGYQILRFSGSEIYNNPKECVKKVFKYIEEFGYDR